MNHPDDPEHVRFAELYVLAGVLPYHRRNELSALLSDADVATLRHPVEGGMGTNTLRAIASGLATLERWALSATGFRLPWPRPVRRSAQLGALAASGADSLHKPSGRCAGGQLSDRLIKAHACAQRHAPAAPRRVR